MSLLPVVIGADAHLFGIEAEYEFAFLSIKNKQPAGPMVFRNLAL